jgi:hypothetical protein
MQDINHIFEDDLKFVADRVSTALNIFNETGVADNKLVTMYGKDEFIALLMTPHEKDPRFGQLRLRTRDMAATWDNVPVGFSKINESRGLLADMKSAAHVSLKRNSMWYMERQIQDVMGDRVVFTELTINKGYLFQITFTNGYTTYLSIVRDDKEYRKSHDVAQLYVIAQKDKTPLTAPMTADECVLLLLNIAMQNDKRASEFVSLAEQYGGKTLITHSYRTQEESLDEAKAVFANGYALKLSIVNDKITLDTFGRYDGQTYLLDRRDFDNIQPIYDALKDFSELPKYEPSKE